MKATNMHIWECNRCSRKVYLPADQHPADIDHWLYPCKDGSKLHIWIYKGIEPINPQQTKNRNNNPNTKNNMAEMNLEVQKQRVLDLKAQLDLMVGRVEIMKMELDGQLDRALENGLPVEIYQKYKAHYLSRLYNSLDVVTGRVMRDDMVYLNDVQVHIQEAIDK